jgi:hypothetical protein
LFSDPAAASRLLKLVKSFASKQQRDPDANRHITIDSADRGLVELCMSLNDGSIIFFNGVTYSLRFPYPVGFSSLTSEAVATL